MLKDLFINMTILISFISMGSQLAKKINFEKNNSVKFKLLTGIVTGILGCILMLFSIRVSSNTLLDFRNIAIVIAALIGGTVPALVSGAIIGVFRITYFGINSASLLGVILAIINAIGCLIIGKFKHKLWLKWIYASAFTLFTYSIVLTILLRSRSDFSIILLIYWISHCLVSAFAYYYIEYMLAANKMFRRLQKESTKDFLTGLNNVRKFDSLLNEAARNAVEKQENLSLLMVDIDFFKKVNDTYGHLEGDIVLKELGKILSDSCRNFDIVSRNGGEEFTVLLLDCPNSQALQIAERTRANVEAYSFVLSTGKKIRVTVSIGVASYPEALTDIEKLVESADTALYNAKRTGRNKVCSF